MAVNSKCFATQFDFKIRRLGFHHPPPYSINGFVKRKKVSYKVERISSLRLSCCCSDSLVPLRRGSGNFLEKNEEWRFDPKNSNNRVRAQVLSLALPFASSQSHHSRQEKYYPRCAPKNSGPQRGDTPPKRDTGIANEKDWDIILLNESINESGTNEDGSTWYRESGEDLGDNGYRCRWTRMCGRSYDDSSEWKEMG